MKRLCTLLPADRAHLPQRLPVRGHDYDNRTVTDNPTALAPWNIYE